MCKLDDVFSADDIGKLRTMSESRSVDEIVRIKVSLKLVDLSTVDREF